MATIKKKMQKGGKMTPMQSLKKKYPAADTTAKGDLRFEDLGPINRYNKKDQKKIMDTEAAFDKKYGKGKPAMKTGGVAKKKMQAGGVAGKQPKAGMVDPKGAYTKVQMRTLGNMKKGGKMSKKK